MNERSEFKSIATSVIPEIKQVRLYSETMTKVLERHPEVGRLPDPVDAIADTISHPSLVYSSTSDPGRSFVFVNEVYTFNGHPLRVTVKLVDSGSARVQTAYFSGSRYSGTMLWSKSNEKH